MSTNNAEGVNFKVSMGNNESNNRSQSRFNSLTIKKLCDWIDSKPINSQLKEELKKSASSYPQQALSNWQKNYLTHLSTAQSFIQKRKKEDKPLYELGDEPYRMPKNNEFD
jgi:hypothetical protein